MSCFSITVTEPSGKIIEVESTSGANIDSITLTNYSAPNIEISQCLTQLPSDFNDRIFAVVSGDIVASTGVSITSSGGKIYLNSILDSGTGIALAYNSGIYTISSTGLQPSGNYSLVGHQHVISDVSGLQIALDSKQPSGIYASGIHYHTVSDITNFNNGVSGLLPSISGGDYITASFVNNSYIISATGLQSSGNYSIVGHSHIIDDIDGLQIALDSKQPSGNYASGIHYHTSSDITDFHTSVSGLLPVTDIIGGANIAISNSGSVYTVNVSGQLGLTAEQVDDRVSNLLVAGTGITLDYNDSSDTLTINTSGLQPSGNYSIVGHSHSSSDIIDFNNSVSGLLIPYAQLNSPNFSGVPTVPTATSGTNSTQIASTAFVRSEISNLVDSAPAVLDTLNELAAALGDDPNFATTVASGLAQKSNIGHTHLSSDITNFNSSVSGLLPVVNIIAGSGIGISSTSGDFTVSVTGTFGLTSEEVDDRVSNLLIGGSYINLDYNDGLNTLTINASGLQPSGNYSLIGHSHSSSDITDFNNAVSGLIPVKNILSGTGINVSNTSGVYTIEATGSGVLSDQAKSLVTTVFNKTGSPIPKMTAVYIDGGQGDLPKVSLAIATSDMTSAGTYGLTYEAISNMQSGKVIVFGALTGLDTDQFNPTAPHGDVNGSIVYLSPSVSGALTLTKPSAPNHVVAIGTIVRTHQNEGVIEVRVQNGFELEELHNVAISGAVNGQFLQYNSTSGLWVPSSSGNFNTLQVNGTGVSLDGHIHTASNITDFNSSVSGLLPSNIITGVGTSGYLTRWTGSDVVSSGSIYQSGNNIGIGTISPGKPLEISYNHPSNSNQTGGLRLTNPTSSSGSFLEFGVGGNTGFDRWGICSMNNTPVFRITPAGVTSFASNFGCASNVQFVNENNTNAYILLNNGAGVFRQSCVNSMEFQVSYVTRATLNSSGWLGIGTSTPSGKLHIGSGDLHFDSSYGLRWTGGSRLYEERVGVAGGSAERMLYLANGDRFEVLTENGVNFIAGFHGANSLLTNSIRLYRAVGIGSNYAASGSLPTNGLAVEGSVGIGTRSPSGSLNVIGTGLVASSTGLIPNALLDVYSTTSGEMVFNVQGTNGSLFSVVDSLSGSLMSVNNNAGLPIFEVFDNDSIIGGRFNQNDFVISSGGNIGIGTANPSGKLNVVGDVNVSGTFTMFSDVFTLSNNKTVSASGDAGSKGNICWDSNYVYICVSDNNWKRISYDSW